MKDILNDLKIIIQNNYLLHVAVLCLILWFNVNDVIGLICWLLLPSVCYVLIYNLGLVAFGKSVGLPKAKSDGLKLVLKHQTFILVFSVIVLSITLFTEVNIYTKDSLHENNSFLYQLLDYFITFVWKIFVIFVGYSLLAVLYSCVIFPDTDVENINYHINLITIHNTFPTHWYYSLFCVTVIYTINELLGFAVLCYISIVYVFRYILNTPPQKKEKIKSVVTKLAENNV